MRSSAASDRLDLERDLATTGEDVQALSRLRGRRQFDLETYLRFLEQLTELFPRQGARQARRRPGEVPPFSL